MSVWEVATVYPLIFVISTADVAEETKEALYKLIYSYIVRRAICGLTPKNLNKTFQRVVGVLLESGISLTAFAQAFADQSGPTVRFPTDDELRKAILTNPLYQWFLKKERLGDILWELELKTRNKFSVGTPRPDGMSIEHILPQGWVTHWTLPDGRKAPVDHISGADAEMIAAISNRQNSLHTLGNLTFITVPGNSAASNSDFAKKKKWLKKSLLALNLEIIEEPNWSESEIQNRSSALASIAIDIWPGVHGN